MDKNLWNQDPFEIDLGDGGDGGKTAGNADDRMLEELMAALQGEKRQETPAAPVREATQADAGWRNPQSAAPVREATQADAGWRNPQSAAPAREATQADDGWRSRQGAQAQPGSVPPQMTANSFADLESFKNAVDGLSELVSANGTRYPVVRTLSKAGGESAVLLCRSPYGEEVAAKVYFEQHTTKESALAARAAVLEYMKTPEGRKYTLAVSDNGLAEIGGGRYYFEITPYCKDGDLSRDPAFSFAQITDIARYLNEALHSMHSAGILHRDIKPANLYHYQGRIVIGDFGIAKLANAGMTNTTGGTDGFRAPESVLAVTAGETAFYFDEACDYYSLGVTLGSLYEGRFVYQDMNAAMITIAVRQGKLPLTKVDPHRNELENLLNGLCRYDSRYRFGYEDVCRWLSDPKYSGSIIEDEWPRPFRMMQEEYSDEKSLFEGITRDAAHWNEGKDLLYSKYFENFFMSFRTDLARAAQVADETYRNTDRDKGLSVFLKSLYAPGPIVWKGYTFRSLRELGNKMAVTRTASAYGEILQKQVISHWLKHTEGIRADGTTAADVEALEKISHKEPELACYWFGNSFAGKRSVTVCGETAEDLQQLLRILFRSPRAFYEADGYDKLMDRAQGAAFYGFLYSLGFRQIIDSYWKKAVGCDEFNKACLLLTMLDSMAVKIGADSSQLRQFFVTFGPLGIAACTKQLAERGSVYKPLTNEGRQILSQIVSFRPAAAETAEDLYKAYVPLMDMVRKLQTVTEDNPFAVSAGLYSDSAVICTDLAGCFAFRVFERSAPLGFHGWIEASEGRVAR